MTIELEVGTLDEPVLTVENVVKEFRVRGGARGQKLRAVDGISFSCRAGETIGIVGESGCGKTTLGRMIAGLIEPTSGSVIVAAPDEKSAHGARQASVQMVYQNPAESLDPRWRIASSVGEPLIGVPRNERETMITHALQSVGLGGDFTTRRPHQLSGGQQQRACIARAIVAAPSVIVLDEAVSGLDALLQRDILTLLVELQARTRAAYVFISHDLRAVRAISSRLVVMYHGRVVESASSAHIDTDLLHPYAVALHSAQLGGVHDGVPGSKPIVVKGEPPSAVELITGCAFAPRCPLADARCREETPELEDAGDGHLVACHHPGELSETGFADATNGAARPSPKRVRGAV